MLTVHRSLPYSSFSESTTETIAKLARLGPAENGEPMENFIELTMFYIMIEEKSPRISCPEYIDDLDKCDKMLTRQCQRGIHRVSLDRSISEI